MSTARKQGNLSDGMAGLSPARLARIDALATYVVLLPWFNVDVLHKLYLNFFTDQPLARAAKEDVLTEYDLRAITCADFLQSPQVSRIDYNVFVVEPLLRDKLRNEVKEDQAKMRKAGEFMLAYADHCRSHFLSTRYLEVFKVEGNLIVNPRAEASRIARHVAAQLNDKRDLGTMEPTVGYYLNLLSQDGQDTGNEELTTFLKGLDNYLKKDQEEAMEEWEKLRSKKEAKEGKSISIKLPRKIRQAIVREMKSKDSGEVDKVLAKVFIDQGTGEIYASSWKSYQTEESTYVFVDNREVADFIISMGKGKLKVQPRGGGIPVYETDSAMGLGLDNVLQALGRWTQVLALDNSQTTIRRDEIAINVGAIEGGGVEEENGSPDRKREDLRELRLRYTSRDGREIPPKIKATVETRGEDEYYVACIGLTSRYEIIVLLPCTRMEKGKLLSLVARNEGEFMESNLSFIIDEKQRLFGITESTDYLKVIVSRNEFSVRNWAQDILNLGRVDNFSRSAGLITVDGIDANTIFRGQRDWTAFNINFITTGPQPWEAKQASVPETEVPYTKGMRERILGLVANNRTEQALDLLHQAVDEKDQNSIILVRARLAKLQSSDKMGIISGSDYNLELNKLRQSIVNIATSLDEGDGIRAKGASRSPTKDSSQPSTKPTSNEATILLASANPTGTAKLQLDTEYREVNHHLEGQYSYRLRSISQMSMIEFIDIVFEYRPNIIHFTGHGESSDKELADMAAQLRLNLDQAGLVFFSSDKQDKVAVSGTVLHDLFSSFLEEGVPLSTIIFNGCYSDYGAMTVSKLGLTVICCENGIADHVAIAFISGFYRVIGQGGDLEAGIRMGRAVARIGGQKAMNGIKVLRDGKEISSQ